MQSTADFEADYIDGYAYWTPGQVGASVSAGIQLSSELAGFDVTMPLSAPQPIFYASNLVDDMGSIIAHVDDGSNAEYQNDAAGVLRLYDYKAQKNGVDV